MPPQDANPTPSFGGFGLRHTHASILPQQNVSHKAVSQSLGHATVAVTLDTYSHVSRALQGGAAVRFEEARQPGRLTTHEGSKCPRTR